MYKKRPEIEPPDETLAGVIEVYDNAIPNYKEILKAVNDNLSWKNSTVGENIFDSDVRNSDVSFFNPFDFEIPEVLYHFSKKVWTYVNSYAIKHDFSFSRIENVNINRYKKGQKYDEHCDDGPGLSRVVSALVYLNEVDQGGETKFTYFNEYVSPVPGRLVIFPSNYAYKHAALPPKNGVKYSAAFWFRN